MPDEFVLGGSEPLSYQQIKKMRRGIRKDIAFEENITKIQNDGAYGYL